jgi:hypothetical protein
VARSTQALTQSELYTRNTPESIKHLRIVDLCSYHTEGSHASEEAFRKFFNTLEKAHEPIKSLTSEFLNKASIEEIKGIAIVLSEEQISGLNV